MRPCGSFDHQGRRVNLRLRVTLMTAEGRHTSLYELAPMYTKRAAQVLIDRAIVDNVPLILRLADGTTIELSQSAIMHVDTIAFSDPALVSGPGGEDAA